MNQPEVDPNFADATAQALWDRIRTHQDILNDEPLPSWVDLTEVRRSVLRRAVSETLEELGKTRRTPTRRWG